MAVHKQSLTKETADETRNPKGAWVRWRHVYLTVVLGLVLFSLGGLLGQQQYSIFVVLLAGSSTAATTHATKNNTTKEDINITRVLLGYDPWPTQQKRLRFPPGALDLNHLETLQHCHIDGNLYRRHLQHFHSDAQLFAQVSQPHKLAYHQIAKSGSSFARVLLSNVFGAKETRLSDLSDLDSYHKFSFVREPYSRFLSSYTEMYKREKPWGQGQKRGPQTCRAKFPFLFQGINTAQDMMEIHCPKATRLANITTLPQCRKMDTQENGTMTQRFEQFVQAYNGITPCDVHLTLQTPRLVYSTKSTLDSNDLNITLKPLDQLYNLKDSTQVWSQLSQDTGVAISREHLETKIYTGRPLFDKRRVSQRTQRRICQLLALDYCCLNFPLPLECAQAPVSCALERHANGQRKVAPWDPLPPTVKTSDPRIGY